MRCRLHALRTITLGESWCKFVILFVSSSNEPKLRIFPPNAIQVQKLIDKDIVKESGLESLGDIPLDEFGEANAKLDVDESPYDTESEIKSMPEDEIVSVSGFKTTQTEDDDTQSQHREELSKVEHIESSLAQQVADKIEDSMPRLVADAFEERVPNLVADTLKNILPQIITDSVKQALPKFDKRVKKTFIVEIPELLIKTINNAFNRLNKKEHSRFDNLQKSLAKTIKIKVGKSVVRNVRKEVTVVRELLRYYVTQLDKNDVNLCELVNLIKDRKNIDSEITILAPARGEQQPPDLTKADTQGEQSADQAPLISKALVVHSSEEKGLEEKPTEDEPPFMNLRPPVTINMPLDQFTDSLFSTTSFEFSPTPLKDDKSKSVADKEDPLKELIPLIDEGGLKFLKAEKEKSKKRLKVLTPEELEAQAAELAAYEAKRKKMLQEYNHCITFRADPLPIINISYRINNFTKEASMRITRDNQLLNLTVYDKFLLWMAKFQWVKTQAAKLGIPTPPQLTAFKLLPVERKVNLKRKRRSELIHQVFVKGNIVMDGMQRNLNLPEGVVRKAGMVIRIQNLIKIDSEYAQEVFDELIYEIESSPDCVQARKIVEKNLDGID
ncbi:hypothetical protein Tco_0690095 [Tanacetum coccineum]